MNMIKLGIIFLMLSMSFSFLSADAQAASVELGQKLSGRILLQVEDNGEAWYVNPADYKRYYMANGDEAYNIMRRLSIGITNTDLDVFKNDQNKAKKHAGKIFLQVQANGEAFYVNVDGKLHYLQNGAEAYRIMRELSLGITNQNLEQIETNVLSEDLENITKNEETISLGTTQTDVCKNIEGLQTAVPTQMTVDSQWNCNQTMDNTSQNTLIPVQLDVCVNLEGFQATIPSGMKWSGLYNCIYDSGNTSEVSDSTSQSSDTEDVVNPSQVSWEIIPYFDTNDLFNSASANNFCGLDLTWDSIPDGGIWTNEVSDENDPSTFVTYSTLMLNVGNSKNISGVKLRGFTLTNNGTASLQAVNMVAGVIESGVFKSLDASFSSSKAVTFQVANGGSLLWPFTISIKINPKYISYGETISLQLQNLNLLSNNVNDIFTYPNGIPVFSESPKTVVKCQRIN